MFQRDGARKLAQPRKNLHKYSLDHVFFTGTTGQMRSDQLEHKRVQVRKQLTGGRFVTLTNTRDAPRHVETGLICHISQS